MDRSKSVGRNNYITLKKTLTTFIDKFNVTPETTHVSMIFYATEATLLFNLADVQFQSNKAIKNKISSLSNRLYGRTRTDLALMKAHDHMFQRVHDRPRRPNVLLVFTDGNTARESAPYSETVPPLEVFIFISFHLCSFHSVFLSFHLSFYFYFFFFWGGGVPFAFLSFFFSFVLSLFLSFFLFSLASVAFNILVTQHMEKLSDFGFGSSFNLILSPYDCFFLCLYIWTDISCSYRDSNEKESEPFISLHRMKRIK